MCTWTPLTSSLVFGELVSLDTSAGPACTWTPLTSSRVFGELVSLQGPVCTWTPLTNLFNFDRFVSAVQVHTGPCEVQLDTPNEFPPGAEIHLLGGGLQNAPLRTS